MTTNDVPLPEPRDVWTLPAPDPATWPLYGASQVYAIADERCANLQEEVDSKQKQIHRRANAMNAVYAELQRVAPWSESNDMDWADEMIVGIGLLAQERARVAELERELSESQEVQFALLGLLADIRKAAGDPTGKLMQAELVDEIADLQRDAQRYQWLRDESGDEASAPYVCGVHGAPMGDDGWLTGELLDEAIDAAIAAGGGDD